MLNAGVDQRKVLGWFHLFAPVATNNCGTPFEFKYFCTDDCDAVPEDPNIAKTPSPSTSLRVCSTVFGGENASSSEIRLILRPLMPPFSSFNMRKYATSVRPWMPWTDRGPL